MDKEERLKKGQKIAGTAVLIVSLLAITKAVIGFLSGSIVLLSDALHSGADLLPVFASWFGLRVARRKPDQRFPYGYYKAENLATVAVSVFILYAAYQIFSEGCQRLFSISSIRFPLLALGIALIDALILYFFGSYEVKMGRMVNAQSLIVMGEENKAHLFSSTAIFVGILAAYLKVAYLEGIITIAISLLILKIGLLALKDSVFALMDISVSEETKKKVAEIIASVPGVEEVFDFRLRKSGPFVLGETKIGIRKFLDVKRAHEIADKIEEKIKSKVSQVDSFTVHIEPFKSNFHHLVMPIAKKKGLNSSLADQFGRAPYFLFINLKGKKIKGDYILENPYRNRPVRVGLSVVKLIARQKSEILVTKKIGEISFHTLRDNLVDVYQAKDKTVKKIISQFINGELSQLKEATERKD